MLLNCGVREVLRVPWTARRSNQSILKEISPGCSLEGMKAETPVLWPPHAKSWLTGKDSDAGKDWGQEEKGMTEDEMAGWHHRLDGCEFEWTWWWTGRPGMLWFMGSQRVRYNWVTELNWTEGSGMRLLYTRNSLLPVLCPTHTHFSNCIWNMPSLGKISLTRQLRLIH